MLLALTPEELQMGSKTKAHILTKKYGTAINHKRIERICNVYGLQAKFRRMKHPRDYYKQDRSQRNKQNGNILNRDFRATKAGMKYVTDISYFKVREGWLFLSAVKDLYNNEIVSWSMSRNCNADLAIESIKKMSGVKHYLNALLHSDLGSTYISQKFLDAVSDQGFVKSFSRSGNCWDNASMESFFGTVKCETLYFETLKTKLLSYKEMEKKLIYYIEFYNNRRIQKKLGWLSPVEYRQKSA